MTKHVDTKIIIASLEQLAKDVRSGDGVANAALWQAAKRMRELDNDLVNFTAIILEAGIEYSSMCGGDNYQCNYCGEYIYNDSPEKIEHVDGCVYTAAVEILNKAK